MSILEYRKNDGNNQTSKFQISKNFIKLTKLEKKILCKKKTNQWLASARGVLYTGVQVKVGWKSYHHNYSQVSKKIPTLPHRSIAVFKVFAIS